MSIQSELTAELRNKLALFKEAHMALAESVTNNADYPLWIQAAKENDDPVVTRELLRQLILNWSYDNNDQLPGKTLQYNGLAPYNAF